MLFLSFGPTLRQNPKSSQKGSGGFLELVWSEGEAQVNFEEAQLIESGVRTTVKYLTLSFPFSDAGFTQCFGGETAVCVAQKLLDIFTHVGGIPGRIVFDMPQEWDDAYGTRFH